MSTETMDLDTMKVPVHLRVIKNPLVHCNILTLWLPIAYK